jgi:hypothetical protein
VSTRLCDDDQSRSARQPPADNREQPVSENASTRCSSCSARPRVRVGGRVRMLVAPRAFRARVALRASRTEGRPLTCSARGSTIGRAPHEGSTIGRAPREGRPSVVVRTRVDHRSCSARGWHCGASCTTVAQGGTGESVPAAPRRSNEPWAGDPSKLSIAASGWIEAGGEWVSSL